MNRRTAIAATTTAAVGLIALTVVWQHAPLLVWNASASVPIGLYAVGSPDPLAVNELVVARAPERLATFLAEGGYLPKGVPLIKHVAALPGSTVCRIGLAVSIDGHFRAQAHVRDHAERLLPFWSGCRAIATDEIFLLNPSEPASLDGRYFGPLPSSGIVGRAVPLWTERRP